MSILGFFRPVALILAMTEVVPVAWGQCPAAGDNKVERFASVQYIQKVHGAAGIELMLHENGPRIVAVLRDYEGEGAPRETQLQGGLQGCRVLLEGKSRRGLIEIHGEITVAAFSGRIRRQIGNRWYTEEVVLKRQLPDTPQFVPSAFVPVEDIASYRGNVLPV